MKKVLQYVDEHSQMYTEWLIEACNQASVSAQNRGMVEMKELVKRFLEKIGADIRLYWCSPENRSSNFKD